jgi:hypothetical protein
MQARREELLPVSYFHVVFTLPEQLNTLAMQQPKLVYDTLFRSAWQTLSAFGKQRCLQLGMIAILHTWGQNMSLHPHLHCVVPGGGLGKEGSWESIRKDGKFLFPVKALSKVFRAKYVGVLRLAGIEDKELYASLYAKPWVVYAKRPFGGPAQVVEYLGRYTHKIAISNHRLQQVDEQGVRFGYKDYRQGGAKRSLTLSHGEFIRRFALHILPKGLVRIRHYGFLSSSSKSKSLASLRKFLGAKATLASPEPKEGTLHRRCPCCKEGQLITLYRFDSRRPPAEFFGGAEGILSCLQ